MEILPFTQSDLKLITDLQPEGWLPIQPYYEYYVGNIFCFPMKVVSSDKVVGIGTAIIHLTTGWLGHIIVDKRYRNRGIGTLITKALMDKLNHLQVKTMSLVATPLGEPIYHKLGFQKETVYSFFNNGSTQAPSQTNAIHYQPDFKKEILIMDAMVSGEERSKLLHQHFENAFVIYDGDSLTGFYMPTLGEGLIEAITPQAGEELMLIKHSKIQYAAIPIENQKAIELLQRNGFTEFRRAVRMSMGEKILWHPEKIFGRIGGNLG